ncbi:hypothetical protein F5887DRAFT_1085747 [Amanita rubescens]|nr:hypothetical protein F5887DRAFT_1085747 [Amanita rubescens]
MIRLLCSTASGVLFLFETFQPLVTRHVPPSVTSFWHVRTLTVGQLDLRIYSISPNVSVIATAALTEEFFQRKLIDAVFDGPLSEYEDSDSEDCWDSTRANATQLAISPVFRPALPATRRKIPLDDPLTDPVFRTTQTGMSWELFDGPLTDCECEGCEKKAMAQNSKERNKILRAERRKMERAAKQAERKTGLKGVAEKRVAEALTDAIMAVDFDLEIRAPVTSTGFTAKATATPTVTLPKRLISVSELSSFRPMTRFAWDGRRTYLCLDHNRSVMAVFLGMPRGAKDWDLVASEGSRCLQDAAARMSLTEATIPHRRGFHPSVAHGISFGGGQESPRFLSHGSDSAEWDPVLEEVMNNWAIKRICGFSSDGFEAYGKRNFDYMKQTLESLRGQYEWMRRPYDNAGVYGCRSLNFGPQTATFPHYDVANLSHSWCSITALGDFNPQEGGHLALWDVGIYSDFPPGSTILLPSSIMCHSNTPIKSHEHRESFVQYGAGGLYRWVENGFMSDKAWKAKATKEEQIERKRQQRQRWERGYGMFMKIEELAL